MIFTKKQNKYGTLLLEFLRFGIFTFGGGWSIIAQMQQLYVEKKKVITSQELLDLTSVFGMCFPPMAVLIAISFAYNAFRQNPWVHAAMSGMQAAVVPIILCAALGLAKGSVTYPPCLLVVLLCLGIYLFTSVNPVLLVVLGVVSGLIISSIYERREAEKHGAA